MDLTQLQPQQLKQLSNDFEYLKKTLWYKLYIEALEEKEKLAVSAIVDSTPQTIGDFVTREQLIGSLSEVKREKFVLESFEDDLAEQTKANKQRKEESDENLV